MRKLALMLMAPVLSIMTVVIAASAYAGSLGQPCTTAPESRWLPMQELQAQAELVGYKVQKAKLANACGELYAVDKAGNRTELFVDPESGRIVGHEAVQLPKVRERARKLSLPGRAARPRAMVMDRRPWE